MKWTTQQILDDAKFCNKCGVELVVGDNWCKSSMRQGLYKCDTCLRKYKNEWAHKHREHVNKTARESRYRRGVQPMSKNKSCSSYLGCHIAEQVLSKVFKDVEVMLPNHKGYDFICNHGKKIDVKSACVKYSNRSPRWMFTINRNTVPDYFLFIGFDNREDLNPAHLWLIPGIKVSHLHGASISVTTITKWDEHRLDIDKVAKCCNLLRGD